MRTHLEFVSTCFAPVPQEDEQVNPGSSGKRLAEFLSRELQHRGFAVVGINAEDWGWRIDLEHSAFPLWIGRGSYPEYQNGFLCFIEPSQPFFRKFLRKISTIEVVDRLAATLQSIFEQSGKVSQMRWWREDEIAH